MKTSSPNHALQRIWPSRSGCTLAGRVAELWVVNQKVMTEEDYIAELRERTPRNARMKAPPETIALADEAVRTFPHSPRLWFVRGNLIWLCPENCLHSLNEALASYKRAIEIDPSYADAWEQAGCFHQDVLHDEPAAQQYFREAEKLRHPDAPGSARHPQA
jgi:tetratricopeptide (TPR) repeat protein